MEPSGSVALGPRYDGTGRFPDPVGSTSARETGVRIGVTLVLVLGPLVGVVVVAVMLWGRAFSLVDLLLAVVFYVATALGITIGFHRGLTHRGFVMSRPLMCVLVMTGSMAFEGAVIDWVATHRRHHAFTDRPGDPHSPYRYGTTLWGQARGLGYAHVGWLLADDPTSISHYAPDLVADPVINRLDRAFPLLCATSLALPFLLGLAITRTWVGGLTALIWAGLARVALLQHVTWSINSLCHVVGSRPFPTRPFDRATNLWPLALVSMGESWHNGHHSAPSCARHGRGRGQVDPTAAAIRVFERLNWVSDVRWTPAGSRSRADAD